MTGTGALQQRHVGVTVGKVPESRQFVRREHWGLACGAEACQMSKVSAMQVKAARFEHVAGGQAEGPVCCGEARKVLADVLGRG